MRLWVDLFLLPGMGKAGIMNKIQVSRCKHCSGWRIISVIPVDLEGVKEFAKEMKKGHLISVEDHPVKGDCCFVKDCRQTKMEIEDLMI